MDNTIYKHSFEYAKEHGETDARRENDRLNRDCAQAIDKAVIAGNYELYRYDLDSAAKAVVSEYGNERVNTVLANILLTNDYDGRYSNENKQWAKDFNITPDNGIYCNTHPAVLDGLIKQVRNLESELIKYASAPEIVVGYEITRSILFDDDRGFALGEHPNKEGPQPYVTYQFTQEDGKRDHYWGHYTDKQETALQDYENRVNEYMADYPSLNVVVNPIEVVEMSTEQNYNQIDGILNNIAVPKADLTDGQTLEEIKELAPETLIPQERASVTEKLSEAKKAVNLPSHDKSAKMAGLDRE